MLQRMNELAVQASNGTNSQSDRQAIQDEISQLTTEIDRVAETTKFNETYLLKGDDGTKKLNLKAHDAGLAGTLTDNGNGTATFKMKALNAGDKVTIGGKEYTIGGKKDDVDKLLAGIDTKHSDVTVNGTTYKYYAQKAAGTGQDTSKGYAAGWYDTVPDDSQQVPTPKYTNAAAFTAKGTGITSGTISVGTKSVTFITDANTDEIDDNDTSIISKTKAYE